MGKLRGVPQAELRKFDDRGWTLFESIIIDSKHHAPKGGDKFGHLNYLVIDDGFDPDESVRTNIFMEKLAMVSRSQPLTPEAFLEEMELRKERCIEKTRTEMRRAAQETLEFELAKKSLQE